MRQITHYYYVGMWHKIFVILLRGRGLKFLQNCFCNNSIYIIRVCKCRVYVRSASRGARAWQDHAHFYLENNYMKTDEYFPMIPFASSRLWSKKYLENFVEHAGPPKRAWQGHTHFLFRKLLQCTRKRMNIFP